MQFGERARRLTPYNVAVYSPVPIVAAPTIRFCSILTNESRPIIAGLFEYIARARVQAVAIRICLFNRSIMALFQHPFFPRDAARRVKRVARSGTIGKLANVNDKRIEKPRISNSRGAISDINTERGLRGISGARNTWREKHVAHAAHIRRTGTRMRPGVNIAGTLSALVH